MKRLSPGCRTAGWLIMAIGALLWAPMLPAQSLPEHRPLRIIIVSDEVNPHGLSDAELTQPGEISAALALATALNINTAVDSLIEIPTDQIEQAIQRLAVLPGEVGAYDVLIYFAHRIPNGPDGQERQNAFVAATEQFLISGGGVVSFHHGIYRTGGKESMQALLGAEATGAVPYDEVTGQDVIAVEVADFIATNGLNYTGTRSYQDPGLSIPLADYPYFNNTPDERYPTFSLLGDAADRVILFASDYSDNGTTHVLGYRYQRDAWLGQVVMYQPGEYQPNALDPTGNNFQILLNAIYAVAPPDALVFVDGFE